MRHRKSGRRLGRNSSHRKAMYRNMVTSLMLHGRIRTTAAKAKELRSIADRVITLGKKVTPSAIAAAGDEAHKKVLTARRVHNIRRARRLVNNPEALNKVFNEYAERYTERPGGYTRILKLSNRPGDNAPMAMIELVVDHPDAEVFDEDYAAEEADTAEVAGEE